MGRLAAEGFRPLDRGLFTDRQSAPAMVDQNPGRRTCPSIAQEIDCRRRPNGRIVLAGWEPDPVFVLKQSDLFVLSSRILRAFQTPCWKPWLPVCRRSVSIARQARPKSSATRSTACSCRRRTLRAGEHDGPQLATNHSSTADAEAVRVVDRFNAGTVFRQLGRRIAVKSLKP